MDGMFYFVSSRQASLEEQRRYCQSFNLGRLLTLKTRTQAKSFQNFITDKFWDGISFIVDLEEDYRDNLHWGDGTNFYDTDLCGQIDFFTDMTYRKSVYKAVLKGNDL
ncbi:hypothetical protein Avbf_12159, partial [Armadillidium vulgare]